MRGTSLSTLATSLLLAGFMFSGSAATTNAPDFKEIYDIIRTHVPQITDASLNQSAVSGLLGQFTGRVTLLGDSVVPPTNSPEEKATVLDHAVLYLRVSRLTDPLASVLANQLRAPGASGAGSNQLVGTVLDLRFSTGDAYGAVKEAVALLVPAKGPLIVLINRATAGAAELLAAELHDSGALLMGSATAGLAMTTQDFTLASGQRLRVATAPIQWHGSDLGSLTPDISVKVGLDEERNWQMNPYAPAPVAESGASNPLSQLLDHTSEADLVRQKRKDGDGDKNPEPPVKTEPARPVLRDPALARAVDLAEGLAALRLSHP